MTDPNYSPETPDTADHLEGYEAPGPGGWEDYPLDELAIRDERRTAIDVVRRLGQGRFVLDPDFQRDFVWDKDKQSRLIESILLRIPLPVFYVAEDDQGRLVVVDGRQRLTTLKRFFSGELKLDLEKRSELHNCRFADLTPRLQNRLEDCQLHFYIIDKSVPERARLDIFERVNGGEVLTRQQMRNALYNGPATEFLREVASTPLFLDATGGSLNVKKMQDREFVNRFMSFQQFSLDEYKGDMDDWLAKGLTAFGTADKLRRTDIQTRLNLGLSNNLSIFGRHAFRKHRRPDQNRSVLNASLFDVMMFELSHRSQDGVAAKAQEIRSAFYSVMDDETFIKAITCGPNTPKEVRTRFRIAADLMAGVFGDH